MKTLLNLVFLSLSYLAFGQADFVWLQNNKQLDQVILNNQPVFAEIELNSDFTIKDLQRADPKLFVGLIFNGRIKNIDFLKPYINLKHLKFFSRVKHLNIENLPKGIQTLILKETPKSIIFPARGFHFKNLKELFLSGNWAIQNIVKLTGHDSLKTLHLTGQKLEDFDFSILGINISSLRLDYCLLKDLNGYNFAHLTESLDSLEIRQSKIKGILVLGQFKNLKRLRIDGSRDSTCKFIDDLRKLNSLSLRNCNLSGSFDLKLKAIEELDLSYNKLKEFHMPKENRLKFLDISNNDIHKLSGIPKNDSAIQVLFFADNSRIESLDSIFFKNLKVFSFSPSIATISCDTSKLEIVYLNQSRKNQEVSNEKLDEWLYNDDHYLKNIKNSKIRLLWQYSNRKLRDYKNTRDDQEPRWL